MKIQYVYQSLLISFFALNCFSQGVVNNGSHIVFNGASQLYIDGATGHYTSQNTGSITPSATSTITLEGDWVNNSANVAFVTDAGGVVLAGAAESIGGSNATAFYNLSLANTGITTLAVNSTTVGGRATFTGILAIGTGTLSLNSNRIDITNSATGAITSNAAGFIISETNAAVNPSIVRWYMRTTTGSHVFPFGVSNLKIPFTFNITAAMGAATDFVDVSTRATAANTNLPWAGASNVAAVTQMFSPNGPFANGSDEVVVDRWWDITPSGTPTANVTFSYRGIENTLAAPYNVGNVGAQRWVGNGWLADNATYGSAAAVSGAGVVGSVTANGLNQFCPWILSSVSAPLPIELINFEATCVNNETTLEWCTASENNNHYFTIEQSPDGNNFQAIGTLSGNITSIEKHCYKYTVKSNIDGLNYFRLKQTDLDNKSTYSKIISIEPCSKKLDNIIITNNGTHQVGVLVNATEDFSFDLNITNSLGQIIDTRRIDVRKGSNSITVDLNHIANGVYYVSAENGLDKITSKKIILAEISR